MAYTKASALYACQFANNQSGGGATVGSAWTTRVLNTLVYDSQSIATRSSNQLTLSAASYIISASQVIYGDVGNTQNIRSRVRNITASSTLAISNNVRIADPTGTSGQIDVIIPPTFITLSGTTVLELQYWVTIADSSGLGLASGSGEQEQYAWILIQKL